MRELIENLPNFAGQKFKNRNPTFSSLSVLKKKGIII